MNLKIRNILREFFGKIHRFLLITTSKSFLKINLSDFSIDVIHRGSGLYYGITMSSKFLFVAARGRMVSSEIPIDQERGIILVFDKNLNKVDEIHAPFPLRDMHEIKLYDNKLWITCSYDNMIAIFDFKRWTKWYPLGEPEGDISDVNHFNSLFFEHGNVYVLAHNKGDSEILEYELRKLILLRRIKLGNQAHNIWMKNGVMYTCSSGEGKLVGTDGWEFQTGGFPRGIAFTDKHIFVGISELAERKDRDYTNGRIIMLDRNWNFERELVLSDEGLVLDLFLYPP